MCLVMTYFGAFDVIQGRVVVCLMGCGGRIKVHNPILGCGIDIKAVWMGRIPVKGNWLPTNDQGGRRAGKIW